MIDRWRCARLVVAAWIVLLSTALSCRGSTVIILLKGDEIWIAADSLATPTMGAGRAAPTHICKIVDAGTFYAAGAGYGYFLSDGFSFEKIIRSVNQKGSLHDIAMAFMADAKIAVKREYTRIKKNQPREFEKFMQSYQGRLVQVGFARIEGGQAKSERVDVEIRVDNGAIEVDEQHSEPTNSYQKLVLAPDDQAENFISRNPSLYIDTARVLQNAIALEAQIHPDVVGGNVSILRLTAQGPRWVERGECR